MNPDPWSITNVFKRGYRNNAFSPIVWFLVLIALVVGGIVCRANTTSFYIVGFLILVLILVFGFVAFMKILNKDPQLLQSEEYKLEQNKMDLIRMKGSEIPIKPVSLSTPYLLEKPTSDEE